MRNSKPPKRPAGMSPEMERALRAQASKSAVSKRDGAIEPVYPEMGAMGAKAGLGALGRYVAKAAKERKAIDQLEETLIKGIKSINAASREMGLRGQVRPVNTKEIADMARRYAKKDKSVLQDIGKLTPRQQQMVRDEIARQYKKVTAIDKAKEIAKKFDKALDPASTGRTAAIGVSSEEIVDEARAYKEKNPKTIQLQEVIMKPKKYAAGGSLKPVPAGKKGLAKLPTEVRNKMGYMMGGGKLDMMYQNGGKTPIVPDPKKKNVPGPKNEPTGTYFESKTGRVGRTYPLYKSAVELQSIDTTGYGAGRQNFKLDTSKPGLRMSSTPVKREDVIKTINKLKSGASRVAKFKNGGNLDMMYAKGGKLKKPAAPNPLNPTKDKNSYISNAVDMSPSTKKQMDALRQAMMYFTGVSPKNK